MTAALSVLIFCVSLDAQTSQTAASASADRLTFTESVKGISSGTPQIASAKLVRSALTETELNATLDFSVSLRLRNFAELEERIRKGEVIAADEMAEKYYPTAADYSKVVNSLAAQGLKINPADKYNLSVFASGTVARIKNAFGIEFGRVNYKGVEYTSAMTAPSLAAAIATPVLGINGLQPHIHPRAHFHAASSGPGKLVGNSPPYTVSEIADAYGANSLSANGSGQKIGIVIDTFPASSDLTRFWSDNSIAQSLGNIEEVQVVAGSLPSPSGEETLDVEWSSGMAPGAKVRVYAATDLAFVHLDQAYQRIINELPSQPELHQISLSYGLGELEESSSQLQTDAQYFAVLAANGVTVFVSSGDGGSTPGNGFAMNNGPLEVEAPANDPHVTSVGGTTLFLNVSTGAVSSEFAWFFGGGGSSQVFARPFWQNGAGIPAGGFRLVPDVALVADLNTGGYLILGGQEDIVGGTSWSSPTWAAFCARINQARANVGQSFVGLLGPKIYSLNGTTAFRDITSGSNGANGLYNAGQGYDMCTGLGVPNVASLVQALTGTSIASTRVAKDFNSDGQADLLWRNTPAGDYYVWLMRNGVHFANIHIGEVPIAWNAVGIGDFLGNGQSDLVWENTATGERAIWILVNGFHAYNITLPTVSPTWHIAGAGDFLGNGQAGLAWENTATGECGIWILNNGVFQYSIMLPTVSPSWHIAGVADFNGDGRADLLWENSVTGERGIWILDNGGYAYSLDLPTIPPQWHIAGAADLSGDGKPDIIWENTVTGERAVWVMQFGARVGTISLGTVPPSWSIMEH
jgi:kumamolisin